MVTNFLNSCGNKCPGSSLHCPLQLPMRKSSQRSDLSLTPHHPEERVKLLKPMNEIEELDDDSQEVHSRGLLNRYIQRPASLENISLVDWAAYV